MSRRNALVVAAFSVLAACGLALPPEAEGGLVAYWPFDNSSVDLAPNANDATLYGGATYDTGYYGQALSLNGSSAYAVALDSPSLRVGAYTVSVWVRPEVNNEDWTGIVGKPGRNFNIWLGDSDDNAAPSGGFVHHRWHDASGTNAGATDANSVPMNAWTHIVIVNDGAIGSTYINGVLQGQGNVSGSLIIDNTAVQIGRDLDGGNQRWFQGRIDDVAIWNEALPPATIQGLANGTVHPAGWLNMPQARLVPGTVGSIMGAAYAQNVAAGDLLGPVTWQIHRMDPTLSPLTTAYVVPAGQSGNQQHTGALGMEFDVNQPIIITQLGVFDDDSDGMGRTISVRLYDRMAPATPLAALTFSLADPGALAGGSRFKLLDTPIELPAGFQGCIVADGYGPGEDNGNWMTGGSPPWTTDSGGGVLSFVGLARWDPAADVYPGNLDSGPANRYAAGTFLYQAQTFTVGDLLAEGTWNVGSDVVDAWFFSLGDAPGPQYLQLTVNYGGASAYAYAWVTGTPEPATCLALAGGLLALVRRRRRRQPPLA